DAGKSMNINRRQMIGLTAGLLASTMLPAWANTARADNGQRILRVAASGLTINGTLATLREQSNVGRRILPSILEPVIATDVLGDLSLQPGIAESWKRIDDRILEVKLRKGIIFHNGDEMKAEDVAFSFSREVMFADTRPHQGDGPKTIRADEHARPTTTATHCQPAVAAVGRQPSPSPVQE